MFTYTFLTFFVVLDQKFCVFIISISFFEEVSNFCNSMLTNHKLDDKKFLVELYVRDEKSLSFCESWNSPIPYLLFVRSPYK